MAINFIPEGFHTITPCFSVTEIEKFIEFLKNAFDAKDDVFGLHTIRNADGAIGTAEIMIGNSVIMIFPAKKRSVVKTLSMYLYFENTDSVYKKALAAGATSLMEPEDMYYGDRNAGIKDAWGNEWWIATHVEDLTNEELEMREKERKK